MKAAALALILHLSVAAQVSAEDRYALIIAGASGGGEYAEQYNAWVAQLSATLRERLKVPSDQVTVLSDSERPDAVSNASNVRRALAGIRKMMSADDTLLLILIGHGTFDGIDAKFNLVGPDLEAAEWAALLKPLPGTVVVVNTTAGSFPFLERLASQRRVVITATDSAVQRFDTQFADQFIKALSDEGADIDKNGRVSMWEAFAAASAGVRRYYQQRGQLATERPLLDDNGDGVGNEAIDPKDDGALASRIYLDQAPLNAPPTDDVLLRLLQRKAVLEGEVEDLKVRRTFMPATEYVREFERIMIDLAKVSHDIRERTKT